MTVPVAAPALDPAAPATAAGELSPLGRLEALCDPGSLRTLRAAVAGAGRSAPGDGVVAGAGTLGGSALFCYAQDRSVAGGSLGAAGGETVVTLLRMARRAGAPVVSFLESGGARVDDGTAALEAYGAIFREQTLLAGRAPQIAVVTGTAAGGGAYSPALADVTVMTDGARLFLTGPQVVAEVTGEQVDLETLGGPAVHARSGVCHMRVSDDRSAVAAVRELLAHLPRAAGTGGRFDVPAAPLAGDPGRCVPDDPRRVYDVRDVAAALCDRSELLELSGDHARNLVTAIGRVAGRSVGIVANQPRRLGGVLDVDSASKAARFVGLCDSYGLPLVVLVDTPGFMPGTRQERGAVLRHGAGLLRAFASATVPRITVILRKAYGGGYIAMNSRSLGADLVLAWPRARIGVLAARQAVPLCNRRELAAGADASLLERAYERDHLAVGAAERAGHVDEVIDPHRTRDRLEWALHVLDRRSDAGADA